MQAAGSPTRAHTTQGRGRKEEVEAMSSMTTSKGRGRGHVINDHDLVSMLPAARPYPTNSCSLKLLMHEALSY